MHDTIEAVSDSSLASREPAPDVARHSAGTAARPLFAVPDDPRLLWFALGVVLVGMVASAFGIARFAVGTTITGPTGSNLGSIIGALGYFAWYFVLMYAFARPGGHRIAPVIVPGLIIGPAVFFFALHPRYPEMSAYLLLWGTMGCVLGVPALAKMLHDRYIGQEPVEYRTKLRALLFASLAFVLLAFAPIPFLDISTSLHPLTYDAFAYRFESTLGFQPSVVLARGLVDNPWLQTLLVASYNVLPLGFAVVIGAQAARPDRPSFSPIAGLIVSMAIGVIGYHFFPVAGPLYLNNGFPLAVPRADLIPLEAVPLQPVPRNGVPSMHFAWAVLLWLTARQLGNRWLYGAFSILLALTFVATMALGEHYMIDLIAAVPVAIATVAIIAGRLPWSEPSRRKAALGGFAIWIAWIVALRFAVPLFEAIPGLSWIAIAATLWFSVTLYRPLMRAFERYPAVWRAPAETAFVQPAARTFSPQVRTVVAMFVLSGFAGLMYEVVFSKSLALTFGGTATAIYTVLATYMGGMALGAWLGGRLAAGRDNPLVIYAFCEMGIGAYCAATALVFGAIQLGYVHLASGIAPDAPVLTALRVALGMAGLMLPTVLMGMTLPILARYLEQRSYALGRSVAVLYAANTIGAALGALLVGYAIIQALGMRGTTMCAVLVNFLVAFLAIRLHKASAGQPVEERAVPETSAAPSAPAAAGRNVVVAGYVALAILGVGGAITLALETIYIHLLAVVAGNSTYAFSLMLFTFLLGLGAGAEAARRLLQRHGVPLATLLGWLEFGLAIVILGGVFLWDAMPAYFASFETYPLARGFAAREVVRGIVCWLAMFPPAFFIGAIYPLAMECIGRAQPSRSIHALGSAAALNTIGNIVGVLVGGFVLLPLLGALPSVHVLAIASMVLGVLALSISPQAKRWTTWMPAATALLLLAAQPASFDYDRLASGANVYFATLNFGKVIDHAESIEGGLTSVTESQSPGQPPVHTLLTNGKFQGNDASGGEMQAQFGFALAPLLHNSRRDRALVIGYGTGVSARTLHEAGFQQLDVVDLSKDIVQLADRHFGAVNAGVTRQPGVSTYITDGRNYLLLQDRAYDVIGIEISSIWFAGAASLYNREFYELARKRLRPDGVLQQWVQLHHLSQQDVLRVLGSVRSEFRYVWLYVIGGQGIIVASNDRASVPGPEALQALRTTASLQPILQALGGDPGVLRQTQLLDPAATDRLLTSLPVPLKYWVSTDDNLSLEYSTPKGNAPDQARTTEQNVQFIRQRSAPRK